MGSEFPPQPQPQPQSQPASSPPPAPPYASYAPQAPPAYGPPMPPPPVRRLTRSSRERMWAGVAGGMAEYFDLDPALVRLLWVAAAVVSGGLAVPVYILAWIILPRDDRPPASASHVWRDWSDEFHSETQRMAEEARRLAEEMRHAPPSSPPPEASAATSTTTTPTPPSEQDWWTSERYVERQRHRGRHPKSTGIVLVTLGVLLLAANAGIFSWVEWRTMWPVIFIGLGVLLLARQTGWGR